MKIQRTSSRRLSGDSNSPAENQVSNAFCFISELPNSILLEFFFRIPIKSIMRCKCVCTAWRKLLSHPDFSNSYAKCSQFTALLCCPTISCPTVRTDINLYLLEISSTGEHSRAPIALNLPVKVNSRWYYSFVGCSNGLVCLSVRNCEYETFTDYMNVRNSTICVFNPFMGGGEFKTLPECKATVYSRQLVKYLFGFSPAGNNYKVLRIGFKHHDDVVGFPDYFSVEESHIITVGGDEKWRRLDIRFTYRGFRMQVVDFGGVFNWIPWSWTGGDESSFSISTFHLDEEKLGHIPIPQDVVLLRNMMELRVFDKMFSLVDFSNVSEITIWSMKNYAESWTKAVITLSWVPNDWVLDRLCPFVRLQDGEILFENPRDKGLVSFNPDWDNSYRVYDCNRPMEVEAQCAPNFFARVEDL